MQNGLFSWDLGSIADAIVTAVFLAILVALYQVATTSGFNVFTADWRVIGENMVNVAFTTAIVSMSKDFISTTKGSVLGITPETAPATPTVPNV
jgi:hypothetical protein